MGFDLFGKLLFTWLSLVMSMMVSFVLSFFPRGEMWDLIVLIPNHCLSVYFEKDMYIHIFRFVLGRAYRGFTSGFLSLRDFSVAISVSPHVCFILVLILISLFPR